MRAIGITEFGGRDRLRLLDVPMPKLGPDSVRIRVKAAGVNPVDWKMREGRLAERYPYFFPLVLGWDAAGIVEEVGAAVRDVEPGAEVFAYCRKPSIHEGTYAEHVVVPDWYVALKPSRLDFLHAAAVPLVGLTAYQALVGALRLGVGETILIQAAGGGVGSFAVQIAAGLGARVIGSASAEKHDYVRSLGAAEVIDYQHEDVVASVRVAHPEGIDAILDVFGGEMLVRCVDLLREGGRITSIGEPPRGRVFQQRGVEASYVFGRPSGSELHELATMLDDGRLTVHLEEVFPLEEAARSHELLEEGHVQGKIVLAVES